MIQNCLHMFRFFFVMAGMAKAGRCCADGRIGRCVYRYSTAFMCSNVVLSSFIMIGLALKLLTVTRIKTRLSGGILCIGCAWASAGDLPNFVNVVTQKSIAVVKIDIRSEDDVQELTWRSRPHAPNYFAPNDPSMAIGSGFLISDDGYVLTSFHVVEGAQLIRVRLKDERSFPAQIVGRDRSSDLALLKVEGTGLPYLTFAKAKDIQVGQWVMAIGSPYGLDFSASVGIISALRRNLPKSLDDKAADLSSVPYIQTDVAINPGNSGGPLFDTKGRVIGVNSQIFTRHGGSIGLSFAVPSYVAMEVIKQLKTRGYVRRGWLGVTLEALNEVKNAAIPLAQRYLSSGKSFAAKVPIGTGVVVSHVAVGSPAKLAGMLAGDLIVSYNSEPVSRPEELASLVSATRPGISVPVELVRQGNLMRIQVKISVKSDS